LTTEVILAAVESSDAAPGLPALSLSISADLATPLQEAASEANTAFAR